MLLARSINRHAHSLRTILVTLLSSVAPLSGVCSLILLVLFIYAYVGMTFFANVRYGEYLSQHYNFENFGRSMLTLFVMITGEDWNGFMHDCAISEPKCTRDDNTSPYGSSVAGDCGNPAVAYVFFTSLYFVGSFFLLSLFVAVISDCFETCNAMRYFGLSAEIFEHFGQLWLVHTNESDPPHKWLHTHQLRGFLYDLGLPLGGTSEEKYKRLYNQVVYMAGKANELKNNRKTTSISFRKLLWLLVLENGDDSKLPYTERVVRLDELNRISVSSSRGAYMG